MAQVYPRRRASSAFLLGIIFGTIVLTLDVLSRLFLTRLLVRALHVAHGAVGRTIGVSTLIAALIFTVGLVCYFLAGLLAARRSRTIEGGVFAGLIAGVIVGVGRVVLDAIVASKVQVVRVSAGGLVSLLAGLVITAAVAMGLAALGALLGRGRTTTPAHQPMPGLGSAAPGPQNYGMGGNDYPTIQTNVTPER